MIRFVSCAGAAGMVILFALAASAQTLGEIKTEVETPSGQKTERTIVFEAAGTHGLSIEQLSAFGKLASDHPEIARAIARDPAVVDDAAFVEQHPALKDYLAKFPDAAADIKANVGNYVVPERGQSSQ
jgi:hypothetical protein